MINIPLTFHEHRGNDARGPEGQREGQRIAHAFNRAAGLVRDADDISPEGSDG